MGKTFVLEIPSIIISGLQTTQAADDIDSNNEEMSGCNETHSTNSLLIQHLYIRREPKSLTELTNIVESIAN